MGLNKKVVFVGCGPGGAGYLTTMACKAVENAEMVIGTSKFLTLFPVTGARIELDQVRTEKIAQLLAGLDDRKVAVLVSGDTGLYSLAASLRRMLPADWEISFVPGISSIQAACALFTMDWQDMRFFSLHYQPAAAELAEAAAQGERPLAILCGLSNHPGEIARELLDKVEPERMCRVAYNIGSKNQVTWNGALTDLAGERLRGQAVLIIDRRTR